MAAVFNGGGGTSLRSEVAWITGYPASAGAWVRPNQTANPGTIIDFCDASDNAEFILFQGNAALSNGTQFCVFNEDNAGSGTASAAAGTATNGRDVYVVARWVSPTNRWIHVFDPVAGTVSSAQDTTSIVNSGIIKTSIGVIYASAFASFGGNISEIFAANIDIFPGGGAIRDEQMRQLALNGPMADPFIRPAVQAYWSLRDFKIAPEFWNSNLNPAVFTPTGLTIAAGPDLVGPRNQSVMRRRPLRMQEDLLNLWVPSTGIVSPFFASLNDMNPQALSRVAQLAPSNIVSAPIAKLTTSRPPGGLMLDRPAAALSGVVARSMMMDIEVPVTAYLIAALPPGKTMMDRPVIPLSGVVARSMMTDIFVPLTPTLMTSRPPGGTMQDKPAAPISGVVARSGMSDIFVANILYQAQLPVPFGRISAERPPDRLSPWPALNATIGGLPPYYFPSTAAPFFTSMMDMPRLPPRLLPAQDVLQWPFLGPLQRPVGGSSAEPPRRLGNVAFMAQDALQWPRLLVSPRPVGGIMMDGVTLRRLNPQQEQMINTIIRSSAPIVTAYTWMWISS